MDKSIDFLTYFDNYKCTYTCDEDRQTECQYALTAARKMTP